MADQVYALIHEEDGAFGISFPDFPGRVSGGASAAKVRGEARGETRSSFLALAAKARLAG